jgi:hypothetical protein
LSWRFKRLSGNDEDDHWLFENFEDQASNSQEDQEDILDGDEEEEQSNSIENENSNGDSKNQPKEGKKKKKYLL